VRTLLEKVPIVVSFLASVADVPVLTYIETPCYFTPLISRNVLFGIACPFAALNDLIVQ
jgi:hypothetical protein